MYRAPDARVLGVCLEVRGPDATIPGAWFVVRGPDAKVPSVWWSTGGMGQQKQGSQTPGSMASGPGVVVFSFCSYFVIA